MPPGFVTRFWGPAGVNRHRSAPGVRAERLTLARDFSGRMAKAIVGLRPSFSAHVRSTASRDRSGEHGAPVRLPPAFASHSIRRRLEMVAGGDVHPVR